MDTIMRGLLLALVFSFPVRAENVSVFLDEAPLADVVKLTYGEIAKQAFVMTPAAVEYRQPFTVSLRDVSPSQMVESVNGMLSAVGFKVDIRGGVVHIDKLTPSDNEILVYKPLHRSARYLADVVRPLVGAQLIDRQQQQRALPPGQVQEKPPAGTERQQPQAEEPWQADQVAFQVKPRDVAKLSKLLKDLDTPTGEVLLKAAVYEVGTTHQDGNALQLALSLSGLQIGVGGVLTGDFVKVTGKKFEGVLTALDKDSRFKSLSRPRVRVRNGAEARFTVGQDVPILGAQTLDRNGNPLQSVEYKSSGIILTAKPEIRDQVIELELNQELSNFIATSTGVNNSPTLIKRAVKTHLSLVPGEVVVLAGLQDEKQDGSESRLPFLRWLLGQQSQQQQTEVLVFIEAERI